MPPPIIPDGGPLDGSETFVGRQMGKLRRFPFSILRGLKGDKGDSIKGDKGDAGTPKRIERYAATSNASSVATFTFSPAFTALPDVQVIEGFVGDQKITGAVKNLTLTGCTVDVKRSRGTLALSAGPFEPAPSTAITIRAMGN